MKLQVVGQMIAFTERETLVSGTVNKYRAEFVFDDSWDGYTKTAVFRADSFGRVTSREVLLAGRAPQGARGLKSCGGGRGVRCKRSRPARGAGIEIDTPIKHQTQRYVAPRKGRVD